MLTNIISPRERFNTTANSYQKTYALRSTLPKTTFILTTSEISAAIRNSKNNNSTGPDGISIRHLKHIGPLGFTYLTNTFNLALNTNTIPHMWKLANIIPILKPDKDHNTGTSFRPISLLSVISKTLEKALLPFITNNIP